DAEEEVVLAVDEERRAGIAGQTRPERLADEGPDGDRASAVSEAVPEDRVGHGRRVATPERPGLAADEPPHRGDAVERDQSAEQHAPQSARLRGGAGDGERGG